MATAKVSTTPVAANSLEMVVVKQRIPWVCTEISNPRENYKGHIIKVFLFEREGRRRYQAKVDEGYIYITSRHDTPEAAVIEAKYRIEDHLTAQEEEEGEGYDNIYASDEQRDDSPF